MEKKVMGPAEAISRFVHDGDHISMGGFTVVRNPVGLVFEIVRRKIRNLHVYAHSQGQALDLLIGSGCVAAVEIAYGGTGRFSPSGPCTTKAPTALTSRIRAMVTGKRYRL